MDKIAALMIDAVEHPNVDLQVSLERWNELMAEVARLRKLLGRAVDTVSDEQGYSHVCGCATCLLIEDIRAALETRP